MKYVPYALAAVFVLAGITAVVCRLLRGPSTVEREAVADAPASVTFCCYCDAQMGNPHPDWCPALRRPAVGRAVVAGDDLAWQADLAKIYADYDRYTTEHRLPGERAS